MNTDPNHLIEKIQQHFSPEELKSLADKIKAEPDFLTNRLMEKSTPETQVFLFKLQKTIDEMNEQFQEHQSLLYSLSDFSHPFRVMASQLSEMSFPEIKFCLAEILKMEDALAIIRIFSEHWADYFPEAKVLAEDPRFASYF